MNKSLSEIIKALKEDIGNFSGNGAITGLDSTGPISTMLGDVQKRRKKKKKNISNK